MPKSSKFIIILILALTGFIIYPLAIIPIKNQLNNLMNPFSQKVSVFSTGLVNIFSNITQIQSLTKTNKELREENLTLHAENTQLQEIKKENEILKNELGFITSNRDKELISAQIIDRSPSKIMQMIKINKGSKDGLTNNQAVISHGYLIGVVSEIFDNYSQVRMITNSNSLIPVVLQKSRGNGLLQGGLQGLIVREIASDSQIEIGEAVLTSGLGADLPEEIPIGAVSKIINKESEIFQQVTVNSPIEINKLEVVFVVK